MSLKLRGYRAGDFMAVRDMMVESFAESGNLGNWLIDRWNFCRMVSHTMHDTYDSWEQTVGIWADEDGIIAGVVNSEGENRGEAFFQVRTPLTASTLEEMFAFAELTLPLQDKDQRVLRLRIPAGDTLREAIAYERGYTKLGWEDTLSVLSLENWAPMPLPEGFYVKAGPEITPEAKALAHAKAFGYYAETEDRTWPLAFQRMKEAPDYRAELDLSVVDTSGEVVSFCTLWYDPVNRHGILEPVGTIPEARLKGLGRAVIEEGLHRLSGYGAEKVYVGSTMAFYKKLGFAPAFTSYVWEKRL
jgi:predicted N-acetyltransferase YhbS